MKRFLSTLLVLSALCTPVLAAKTVFIDGSAATKTPGTKVTAAYLNAVNNHRHDGLDSNGSGALDYAAASGTKNALTATLPKAMPGLITGMPVTVKALFTNSSTATLNLSGTGVKTIHKLGGTAVAAGDIQQGQIIQVAYDGTNWQLLSYNSPPVTDAVTLSGQTSAMLSPPGMLGDFAMPTVPLGWLICDGRAVLRSQYPALYAAVGTTWGAGDNVTTFNLPDFRGEFRRGWDNGRGVDSDRQFASFQAGQDNALGSVDQTNNVATVDPLTVPTTALSEYIATGGDGHTITFNLRFQNTNLAVRPRNLAVLTCIKY